MMSQVSKEYYKTLLKRKKSGKYKYIFPLDKSVIPLCNKLKKEYPKNLSDKVESNPPS